MEPLASDNSGDEVVILDDAALIDSWLAGHPNTTQIAYRRDAERMLEFVGKPLRQVRLEDLQAFSASLGAMRPASVARILASCRSLLSFGVERRQFGLNEGRSLKLPSIKNQLAERILTEREVRRLIKSAKTERDSLLISLLYQSAARNSEVCGLRWRDVAGAEDGGAILTLYGKGGKTRFVRVDELMAKKLHEARGDLPPDAPVFGGREDALSPRSVWRVLRSTALRAGIDKPVSPHFLRHSHASHALAAGAPIDLVRSTLGHTSVATTDKYLHVKPGVSSGKYLRVR